MDVDTACRYQLVIENICELSWDSLSREDLVAAAWGYYFFSVQFRESLMVACEDHPEDGLLQQLRAGECDTDNLSPFPGVAVAGEKMNHDEFMRRVLLLSDVSSEQRSDFEAIGAAYLAKVRAVGRKACSASIATYEDGGLEKVFTAILRAPDWKGPALAAFRHFLVEHIRFDSDDTAGHGALSRHLGADDSALPLWLAFRDLLLAVAPALETQDRYAHA